jgi:lysyl oxidase
MTGRARVAVLGAVAALSVGSPAAPAGASPSLTKENGSARWSGSVSDAAAPHPAACTPASCRSHAFELRLPRGRAKRSLGLLVSLRWPPEQLDAGYDLDLYLYGPAGDLVAHSNSIIYSTAEGLWLQSPATGRYRVVVAPRDVAGTVPYELVAAVRRGYTAATTASWLGADRLGGELVPYERNLAFRGTPPRRRRAMLPDLVPAKPRNFHLESTLALNYYQATQRVPAHQPSCYPQESAGLTADDPVSPGARPLRCLRWDMTVRNTGAGPFELRAYPESQTPTDGYQAVYRSDGTYTLKRVGGARFSSAHGHIHFGGLEEVGLYAIRRNGSRGKRVAGMPDKGFCAIDIVNPSFGTAADGPSRYRFPGTCDAEDNLDPRDPLYPGEQYFRMGVSSGWADTYPWFIPDQYVDVTNVRDGRYLLVHRLNTAGRVAEVTSRNNEARACVQLAGNSVRPC